MTTRLGILAALVSLALPAVSLAAEAPAPADDGLIHARRVVVLSTSEGKIVLELFGAKAPKAVTNFVTHAANGYYDGLTFHRVIEDFMIQGGDPSGDGTGGESIWGKEFEDEITDIPMVRGTVAMANRGPNTNGSQFFIIQALEAPWLTGNYTAFGRVIRGMAVVDAIARRETDARDRPVPPVTFTPTVRPAFVDVLGTWAEEEAAQQ